MFPSSCSEYSLYWDRATSTHRKYPVTLEFCYLFYRIKGNKEFDNVYKELEEEISQVAKSFDWFFEGYHIKFSYLYNYGFSTMEDKIEEQKSKKKYELMERLARHVIDKPITSGETILGIINR